MDQSSFMESSEAEMIEDEEMEESHSESEQEKT